MLLKDFTIYYLDFDIIMTLLFLFWWFTLLVLNYLVLIQTFFIFKKYIFFYTNLLI